ncbi:MAG: ABC transporter permease [Clostridiales bacterium]|nr:ABC transporter permease [Clostridiales bacterium]
MFRDISTVYKKEIKSIIKDKTILLMCLFVPFLFMVMEGFIMSASSNAEKKDKTYNAYYIDAPAEIASGLKAIGFKDEAVDRETCINDIKNKDAEMLIIFPKDFRIDPEGKNISNIEIYYNSSNMESLQLRQSVSTLLDTLRPEVFTINADTSIKYDLGEENYQIKNMIASMVPGLLLVTIIYGIMTLASNIIAGDKESNFLNTVLITPVSRSSVAIGKALAVMTAAGISSISAFAGLAYLMKQFEKMLGDMASSVSYTFTDYILVFLIVIFVTFALVSLVLILSTLAKTSRTAQTLSLIPVLILFVASMFSSNASLEALLSEIGFTNYMIPMWNATYLIKNILLIGPDTKAILVTCGINLVFGILCLAIISNLFNREKIVNE